MDLINRVKQSKDGKIVLKNFGYLTLLQFSSYLFPLITMPYLARVIGADGFGKIAFASAVILWLQTISDWGFNYTSTRDVAQAKGDKDVISRIFSNTLWSKMFLSVFTGVLLLTLIIVVPTFRHNAEVLAATFIMVPGLALYPEWFFQATEKMKVTTILGLFIRLFFTILVFVFIREKGDYIYQPLLIGSGYLLSGIVALYIVTIKWGYKLYRPIFFDIKETIINSTNVFANNILPNFYNSFSIMLMGFWGGPIANGIYDGANRFISIISQIQEVLSRVFFPFLSRRSDKHSIYAIINTSFAILGALFLIILGPYLIELLLGNEFRESIVVLRILSISIIFQSLNNTYGINYLLIKHYEKDLRNNTIVASVVGFVLSFVLVYLYTYIGAALVILISRFLLGFLSTIKAYKRMKK